VLAEVKKEELKYEPQLLSTKELIDRYWGQCVPLLQKCIDKQMDGELDIEDIYSKALKGEMFIIAVKNDSTEIPDVKLALVLELVYYPKYTHECSCIRWQRFKKYDKYVLETCLWLGKDMRY